MGKKRRNNQGGSTVTEQLSPEEELLQQGADGAAEEPELEGNDARSDAGVGEEKAATASESLEEEVGEGSNLSGEGQGAEGEVSEVAEVAPSDAAAAPTAPEAPAAPEAAPAAEVVAPVTVETPAAPGVSDGSVEKAPEVAPVAPVVQEAPVAAAAPAEPKAASSENLEYLENIRSNGTPIQKQALETVELFCSRMRPRAPITAEQAMTAQRDMLDFLTVLLRKDYEDFRKGWATLLVYFAEHHGDRPTAKDYTPLSEYSTSRHLDAWKDEERANAYNNLLTLLRITRNNETRKQDVKRIRLEAIAPTFLNARCMDNLQRFYS